MKAEEIILIFKNALVGHYGTVYGQLSVAVLLQWFEAHENERNGNFEAGHQMQKSLMNGSDHNRIGQDPLTNSFDDLVRNEAGRIKSKQTTRSGYYTNDGQFIEYEK